MTILQSPPDRTFDRLMSPEQVAARLDLEVSTVLRAIGRGDLPSVRFGEKVWVETAAFERMLDIIYANYGPTR